MIPFGVCYDREKEKWYYDPNWKEKIKKLFTLVDENELTYEEIKRLVGVPVIHIKFILSNKIFIGIRENKYRPIGKKIASRNGKYYYNQEITPEEERTIVRVIPESEALIAQEQFYRVQEIMKERAKKAHNSRLFSKDFYYAGILYCECGRPLWTKTQKYSYNPKKGNKKQRRDFYYACKSSVSTYKTQRKQDIIKEDCEMDWMRKDITENTIDSFCSEVLITPSFYDNIVEVEIPYERKDKWNEINKKLTNKLTKLEKRKAEINKEYINDSISIDRFNALMSMIETEKKQCETQMNEINKITKKENPKEEEKLKKSLQQIVLETLGRFKYLLPEEKRRIVSGIFNRIYMSKYTITGFDIKSNLLSTNSTCKLIYII